MKPGMISLRRFAVSGLAFFCWFVAGSALHAQDRVTLLIANSDYGEHQLPEAKANVELLHYDAGDGKIIPQDKWVTIPIDLTDVDPVLISIDKALVPGSFVRILPALPKGVILVWDMQRK